MSNVLGAIYTLGSILFQLQSYGFFVKTCKTNWISNHSYCHVHMCAYINQPRATCWDNWLAPIRRWHHAPLPEGVLPSARTTDGAAATACLASKAGVHFYVLLLDRKNPIQFLKKPDLQYSPTVIGWLIIGMKNVCQDAGFKVKLKLGILWNCDNSGSCVLVHRPRLKPPFAFA